MSMPSAAPGDPYFAPGPVKVESAFLGYGGFWRRFFAMFLDDIILGAIAGLLTPLIMAVLPSSLRHAMQETVPFVGATMVAFLIGVAYHALMNCSTHQASLGKIVLGLKVTDTNGQPLTYGRAIAREVCKILSSAIFCIGYIMAAFTQRKQALHDLLGGTLVLKAR